MNTTTKKTATITRTTTDNSKRSRFVRKLTRPKKQKATKPTASKDTDGRRPRSYSVKGKLPIDVDAKLARAGIFM